LLRFGDGSGVFLRAKAAGSFPKNESAEHRYKSAGALSFCGNVIKFAFPLAVFQKICYNIKEVLLYNASNRL
jgi:hypothetical protein